MVNRLLYHLKMDWYSLFVRKRGVLVQVVVEPYCFLFVFLLREVWKFSPDFISPSLPIQADGLILPVNSTNAPFVRILATFGLIQ